MTDVENSTEERAAMSGADLAAELKEIQRPEVLYHASENRNIKQFEPRAGNVRDAEEGPVVFATPSKEVAAQFIVRTDSSWANGGYFGDGVDGKTYFFAISDMDRFKAADHGGAIYELPGAGFDFDPHKGLGDDEWTSPEAVVPSAKMECDSGLEAMIEVGVQVYLLTPEEYRAYREAPGDEKLSIISRNTSINQQQGRNIKLLPGQESIND